eukprot:818381-Karenia_brevis.AAC.1
MRHHVGNCAPSVVVLPSVAGAAKYGTVDSCGLLWASPAPAATPLLGVQTDRLRWLAYSCGGF